MSYNLHIGNAKPEFSKEDDELEARCTVEVVELPHAPAFPNDEMTGRSNSRYPSYGAWHNFCREAGIYDLFYDKQIGLIRQHPGCFMLNHEHLSAIKDARKRRERIATKPPGFNAEPRFNVATGQFESQPDNYDYILARLLWLEFWVEWALNNCETPAIYNS